MVSFSSKKVKHSNPSHTKKKKKKVKLQTNQEQKKPFNVSFNPYPGVSRKRERKKGIKIKDFL
jgi:hypothetical protein